MALTRECPECRKQGRDTGGDHLFMMQDGRSWCCNRKDIHENGKPYYEGIGGKSEETEAYAGESDLRKLLGGGKGDPVAEPDELPELPGADSSDNTGIRGIDVDYRDIKVDVYRKFKVSGEYDSSGKLIALRHRLYETDSGKELPEKVRKLPKDFYVTGKTGKGTKIQFFGQSIFPRAKRLLITEGELDAMSAYQMLEKWRVAVVSLPLGANVKCVMDNQKYLRGFKEVYIAMDQDDAGKAVARDIANLLPSAKFLSFTEKDINDMLRKGKEAEFISSFWDAEIYKPESIVRVSDVMDRVMAKPVMGRPWPWPSLTAATYGRNDGQGIYVGAGVKIGKSEFINEVVAFDIRGGEKIAVLKYEEPPFMTVKRVAGKLDGIFYHRPGVAYSDAALKATALSMEEYLLMYPAFGRADWSTTKEFVRYAAMWGAKTIIIDPVTKLTNHLNSSDTESELRTLSDELACMANDMGFYYIVTCHLKAPVNGPPHERGGKVLSNQFRGSRAMMENTYYMLGIQRNKDPDLPEKERNTSTFVLLEDRNFGNACQFPVYYDGTNQSYLEPAGGIF